MKVKYTLTALAALSLATTSNAALSLTGTGLVAHYTFEGASTAEALQNKANPGVNDLTATNIGNITFGSGPTAFSGNAANFGGSTDTRLNSSFGTDSELGASYTIGGFFYFPSTTSGRNYAFEGEDDYKLSLGSANDGSLGGADFNMLPYSGRATDTSFVTNSDEWVFLAVVVDGANVSWYQDGVIVSSSTKGDTTDFTGLNFGNGRNSVNRGNELSADEIFIYDRALSQSEISAISVPEPSSTALIGLAGLGFILRRRR